MTRRERLAITCSLFAALAYSIPIAAQRNHDQKGPAETVKLTGIGEVNVLGGTHAAYRTYADQAGAEGRIIYVLFSSVEDAKKQSEEWLKAAKRVVSREVDKKVGRYLVSDRIVAVTKGREGNQVSLIIGRDDMNCYLIQATSLDMGMKIESLIDPDLK
jgi:hypothetical protein